TNHAEPKARPSATKRYALALGTPTAWRRKGAPTATSTEPPRMPRRPRGPPACMVERQSSGPDHLCRQLTPGEPSRPSTLERLRVLEAAPGVEDDDALAVGDPAVAAQPRDGREGGATLGAHEHPFALAREAHPRRDLVLGHGHGGAPALAQRAEHEEIAERLRHADAGGEGLRVRPRPRFVGALSERLHDRRAAGGLRGDEARRRVPVQEADLPQLGERLPHADEPDSAAGWIHDHVGELPSELLRELEPHRLLAFDAVRLLQRR